MIALEGRKATITLEPGGQLELSGEACESIHCAEEELAQHVNEIVEVADELGLAFLGLGMQPLSPLEDIEWVPKVRYGIMAPYMSKVGKLGHRMMKQTATVQANIDFESERDAMTKVRLAMGLSPILTAAFANSPISDGKLNGYLSYRQHVWTDTDRDRCGLLPFAFSRDAGFEDYADWALDVPMYFIRREGKLVELTGLPFREFLKHGAAGHHATMADWQLHLTTLFPETRLKTYIEIRSVDSQPPERMLALPALVKGVFYDDDCMLGAWDLVQVVELVGAPRSIRGRAKGGAGWLAYAGSSCSTWRASCRRSRGWAWLVRMYATAAARTRRSISTPWTASSRAGARPRTTSSSAGRRPGRSASRSSSSSPRIEARKLASGGADGLAETTPRGPAQRRSE